MTSICLLGCPATQS